LLSAKLSNPTERDNRNPVGITLPKIRKSLSTHRSLRRESCYRQPKTEWHLSEKATERIGDLALIENWQGGNRPQSHARDAGYTDKWFGSRRCNDQRISMIGLPLAIELGVTPVFARRENKQGACYSLVSSRSVLKLAGVARRT
jgi:hypothetical protein